MTTWWHGTRRGFQKGGLILPPSFHGKGKANDLPDHTDDDWVFITPDREIAEEFAYKAAVGKGRPRVLQVVPLHDVFNDWATYGGEDGYLYRTASARVIAVELLDPEPMV